MKRIIYIFIVLIVLVGCGKQQQKAPQKKLIEKAFFCADSAYLFIADQVQLGPRVLGTSSHTQCIDYLTLQLQRFGADVEFQQGTMLNYADQEISITNIIGRYNSSMKSRILLAAHYDSRPWADHDIIENQNNHILGANDGASGVGVLLEIARQLNVLQPNVGVDIVFFDAEDIGAPEFYTGKEKKDDWCLGSQYWAANCKKEQSNIDYQYGIVLDMVGAGEAEFPYEYFSVTQASEQVYQIWQTAAQLGYGHYFVDKVSYPITDDHYYVSTIANIPCVDVIHYVNPTEIGQSGFFKWWHTIKDDMSNINKATLDAVGTTILTFIIN